MRTEGTRVCRRFAFLIFSRPGAIEMVPVPPPAAIGRDRVRRFLWFVEQNSDVTRRENTSSLRAQRSNPALRAKMDCFVANAPRNDA
jgi:hypothetical protein